MGAAKELRVEPISGRAASALVRRVHYSHRTAANSQVHLGVFLGGRCLGAMQFGPSMDKRNLIGLVRGTGWNQFIELNRMAFDDALPRNSESRALGVAMRMLRASYPALKWVVSFADATQCGDGAIYRASGFVLTGIRRNATIYRGPGGDTITNLAVNVNPTRLPPGGGVATGTPMRAYRAAGYKPLPGHQLRYVYFLDPEWRERLAVPVIPFARIAELGAGMYRGQPVCAGSKDIVAPADQAGEGGASPTPALPSALSAR